MLALVDANNMYVSCERVFAPRLVGRPAVVLSSNDGACLARSNEAKELGIEMAQPWFHVKHLQRSAGLIAVSANFELYSLTSAFNSDPAFHRFGNIARQLIEAKPGLRCMFMHDVDQLLEQYEVTRIRSDTGSDHDAIDSLLFELALNDGLGRIAEVGQDCPVPARCAARLPDVLAEVI